MTNYTILTEAADIPDEVFRSRKYRLLRQSIIDAAVNTPIVVVIKGEGRPVEAVKKDAHRARVAASNVPSPETGKRIAVATQVAIVDAEMPETMLAKLAEHGIEVGDAIVRVRKLG